MTWEIIREKLGQARRAKGLTLSDVAGMCQSSPGYIHDIESGRTEPSLKMLTRIAYVLDVNITVEA